MSTAEQPDMLAAALAAYDNGICVVRASTNGTKKPLGQWKQYQDHRPTRDQVIEWFRDGHAGMGAVCGSVSGDLEMFELEGRFMAEHAQEFADRIKAAGLELLLKRLANGFQVISPSDGRHFIYHNDGPVDGNTKLAHNSQAETLIETRGEGGFVVLPPSHGAVHPTGKAWANRAGTFSTIPTITSAEREALFAVARSFDEAPTPQPVTPVATTQRAQQHRWTTNVVGDSWFDAVIDHLQSTWSTQALLEHYGWMYCYTDRHNRILMCRPGKDEGVSGSINENGRLCPFSSSTPFQVGGKPPATYDQLDIIATYEHGGDRQAAARTIADTTGIMEAWRRARDAETVHVFTGIDTSTGEIINAPSTGLDEAFWDERPVLSHIRQAARSRLVAPAAVLGAILARVAAFTPPSTCLPPTIGSYAPLSLYLALRGNSGDGKSSPVATAADLLPGHPPSCIGPLALGTGEGLVEAFMELVEETDGQGKKRKVKKQIKHGALFNLDEGQLLSEIGNRKGATIMPVLRTAWSGGDPGQANASIETRRSLKPGSYAVGIISLWQDKAAVSLLGDVDGGTPQRFIWLDVADPGASAADRPPWPGPLAWQPPPMIGFQGVVTPNPLTLTPAIELEVAEAKAARSRRDIISHPLDAHRNLNKLKLAGVLAVLDDRTDITADDWHIAERIMHASDTTRDWVLAEARRSASNEVAGRISQVVLRETVAEKSAIDRALARAAKAVYRAVAKGNGTPVGRRALHHAITSRDRQHVTIDDAVTEAERLHWIVARVDGWQLGEAKPA